MTWHAAYLTVLLGLALLLGSVPAEALTYYVSSQGADTNRGTSPKAAWKSLARVNAADLRPGDRLLFRRGDRWRGQLRPRSGSPEGVVTYGAYGQGPKPVLLGSVDKSRPEDWHDEGGHIWSAGGEALGVATLPSPNLGRALWSLYTEAGAQAAGASGNRAGTFRVRCLEPGTTVSQIQVIYAPFPVQAGTTYRLTFRARASESFPLHLPELMQATRPWTSYAPGASARTITVGPEWRYYSHLYECTTTSEEGRLTFFLGGSWPKGATLTVEGLSFAPAAPGEVAGRLPMDVGNLLFDGGAACGVKKWQAADLKQQDDFWYDGERQVVKVYSVGNPARRHHSIECALTRHLIDESGVSYASYENLDLRYSGAHGIGGGNTHHITVRECDLSFIGGGFMQLQGRPVRYGNGIEFWGAAHDNLVERCRLWEIYDAALTNQNGGEVVVQADLTYRDNVIWNSEYSFEFWNGPEASLSERIRFEHNTCVNAGHGWGHRQRPDPGGRQLCFYSSPAQARDIVVRGNIFAGATDNALYAPDYERAQLASYDLDDNLWYQAAGDMVWYRGGRYPMTHFAQYQADLGLEPHSHIGQPRFRNAAKHDYRLAPGSPGEGLGAR